MNYDLAKQLKDAGFPQKTRGLFGVSSSKILPDGNLEISNTAYIPTLSELIEACGGRLDELSSLSHPPKEPKWGAHSYSCEECGWSPMIISYGSTPEEAVAKLWLELNK